MNANYPWKTMNPKDYIQIEATNGLTFKDMHVLTKLYQPLIGAKAYTLYLSLFADLDFKAQVKSATISELLTKLDTGIQAFYQARVKLEGLGLLRIYRKKDDEGDYFYEMLPPLSAEAFYKDSLLRTLLIEKIGERHFRQDMESLLAQAKDKQAYEETTRSFLDVYHFDVEHSEVLSNTDFMPFDSPKRPKLAETIENIDSFDYDFFKKGLDKHFVKRESLDQEIKELIYTYHVIYALDEMTMQELILQSADVESGEVNKNKFTKNVQDLYQNKQKAQIREKAQAAPEKKDASDQQELAAKGFSKGEMSIIRHAKKTAPAHYLRSIKDQKNGFVTSNEQWVLKELVEQSPLNKEVINILLHYVLVGRESVMLDKNYTMTIANDWAQSDVKSAEDAILKVKNIYKKSKKSQKKPQNRKKAHQKSKRKEKLPAWAKEENNDTAEDDKRISQEEAESLQERLDRLKKLRQEKGDN